jgi:hypothetical protein
MALTMDGLKERLDKEDLNYFVSPRKPMVRLGIRALFGHYEMVMLLELDGKFLQFRTVGYAECPANSPHLAEVLKVLAAINYKVRLLKFGWDPDDGEIAGYADLWLMDSELTQEQFSRMVGNFVQALDVNAPRIRETAKTGRDPGEFDPEKVPDEDMPERVRKVLERLRAMAEGKKKKKKEGVPQTV